jgi:hypothetical protein
VLVALVRPGVQVTVLQVVLAAEPVVGIAGQEVLVLLVKGLLVETQ